MLRLQARDVRDLNLAPAGLILSSEITEFLEILVHHGCFATIIADVRWRELGNWGTGNWGQTGTYSDPNPEFVVAYGPNMGIGVALLLRCFSLLNVQAENGVVLVNGCEMRDLRVFIRDSGRVASKFTLLITLLTGKWKQAAQLLSA